MGLSRMCKKCKECPRKDECPNKRMEALACLTPIVNVDYKTTINMGERGNGIINRNDIAEAIAREINKSMKLNSCR